MTNNESRRYKHDIKRVGDLAERPVEMFKRDYDDKTSLVLKSKNIPENEIFMEKNGIKSVNPIYINTNVIPFQMSIDLDLSKSKYHYIKLEDNLFVNDIINFENGVEYKFYISQDDVGSHNISFGSDINALFKDYQLNLKPNSTTLIKITPINKILYIEFDINYNEAPPYIVSLTPETNSENININQNTLTATFTKDIVFGVGDISIKRLSDDSIFQTFIVDNDVTDADLVINGNTLTINTLDFEYDEQYYVTISNGSIESFDGITFDGISNKFTWTFKTAIPFTFTIDTTLGSGSSFDLPLRQYRNDLETDQYTIANNYDMLVDWGDGSSDVITSYNQAEKNHTYISGGTYEIKVSGLCESWGFYDGQIEGYVSTDYNKLTNVIEWGYIGIIDASTMFFLCENISELNGGDVWCKNVNNLNNFAYGLTNLNIPNWDTSNIINIKNIFNNSDSIINLNISNWDVSNFTDINLMFANCSSLTTLDVSNWDVSNVTNMGGFLEGVFRDCTSLTTLDISNWDVSNVTNMQFMFHGCSSLITLDISNWDVSNVTYMNGMFISCSSLATLDVSNWDVSNITNMNQMFNGCSSLTTIDVSNWNVSNVIDMQGMFISCSSLDTLDVSNWNVSNVSNIGGMFERCSSLATLDVSNWDVSNITNMNQMFAGCSSLTTLDIGNWDVSNVKFMIVMFAGTPLDTPSYDALLIGWSGLPSLQSNVRLDVNLAKYQSLEASKARQHIIDTYGWTIIDADQTDAFEFTIDTTLGTGSSFDLPLRSGYNYDMLVDWGDGQTSEITSWDDAEKNHTYVSGGTYEVKISGLCEAWYFNYSGDRLKLTSIDQWGNTSFINMANAFYGCSNLTTVNDTDGIWCKKVVDMSFMFDGCSSLSNLILDNWDVSNVNNMSSMFGDVILLNNLNISNWDVSNVVDMSFMFIGCELLITLDISSWNVSNVSDMKDMFRYVPLDTPSYNALLIGWSQLPSLKNDVNFTGNFLLKYSSGAADARQYIIDTYGWTIQDGGQAV